MEENQNNSFRFITNEIDVSDLAKRMPAHISELIEQMEQADKDNEYFIYAELSDSFEIFTKQLVPDVLTMKKWRRMCAKYSLPPE